LERGREGAFNRVRNLSYFNLRRGEIWGKRIYAGSLLDLGIGLNRYILPYYIIRLSRAGDAHERFYESLVRGEAAQEIIFPETISASEWQQIDLG